MPDKSLDLKHPTDSVRPNGELAVNCTGFGCTAKGYFVIISSFHRVSFGKYCRGHLTL